MRISDSTDAAPTSQTDATQVATENNAVNTSNIAPDSQKQNVDVTMDQANVKKPRVEAPWIILVALLLATFVSAYQSREQVRNDAEIRFQEIAVQAADSVVDQVRRIEDFMTLGGVVIAASPQIDDVRWNMFLESKKTRRSTIAGLIRLEYRAALALSGASPPSLVRHFESKNIVVDTSMNATALNDAIARSKLTQQSTLVADTSAIKSTASELVVIVKPVFATFVKLGQPIGYMLAYVRPSALITEAELKSAQRLHIDVTYRNQALPQADDANVSSSLNTMLGITVAQTSWVLRIRATSLLESELSNRAPKTILIVGILGTMLLAGMVWLLTRLREQAATLAKSMTLKLRDQVKFTDDLIELNPNPIYRKDAKGRFVLVNRAWEQLHQRNRVDVIGKTTRDFLDPSLADITEKFDEEVLNSADGFEVREAFVLTSDGRRIPTIIAKQVIKRADGSPDGIIGTVTDMSEVNHLQREVAKQREQLDLVIRSSQQGIFDAEINPIGNAYFSAMFREILGYGATPITSAIDWQDLIHPDDRDIFYSNLIAHIKKTTPYLDVECRAIRFDGKQIWLRTRGLVQYDDVGSPRRLVGSVVDVTVRREAEQNLIEANVRVTEAAKAKEAFLATMSHEIRTPMNGVLGMAGLLAETKLNDEQRDYIRLIRASGDTLLRLINDVLDFSKIESGHMTLEAVSVEFISVIEEAIELVAEKAREKKLLLVYDVDHTIPAYIVGDATRIRQILMNLLSNAIKFTESGEIFLAATSAVKDDGKIEVIVKISDTGIGIPPERVNQLFQPFMQVDASTTRKYGGTGLGLVIVKRLVTMMGGTILLDSVLNEGTTFTFTIVTQAARGPLRPYMQADIPEFIGKRLLFVDSSAHRRQAIAARYPKWGITTLTASDSEAASRLTSATASGEPIDILMTDTILNSVTTEALQVAVAAEDQRRRDANLPALMVILMSAYSRAELAQLTSFDPIRHNFLVVRPTSRGRMFDVLVQAVSGHIKYDMATRPFVNELKHDADYDILNASKTQRSLQSSTLPLPFATQVEGRAESTLNILVAEDNEINQRVVETMLRRLGHHVTMVADGQAAVDMMQQQLLTTEARFDIVLMDIHMPILDGIGATSAIKKLFLDTNNAVPLKTIPIVAMTAHALAGDREHYLQSGLDDYISKPIRTEELVALLSRAVPEHASLLAQVQPLAVTNQPKLGPVNRTYQANTNHNLPLLDMEQLEDLRGLPSGVDGESGTNGLIELFKTKSRERLRLMSSCLVDSNWLLLGDTAHSLRGAAASIGFPRVAATCKALELAARRLAPKAGMLTMISNEPLPTQSEVDELFEQITFHFYEAEAALAKWLSAPAQ
jgi:two-component system, sensor histidine kinase and response regulator